MEVELLTKKENILLNRVELEFKVKHKKEKTPERDAVKAQLAPLINVPKENIVIAWMHSAFGAEETLGYAKAYSSVQDALKSERKHLLARNKLIEVKEKKVAKAVKKEEKPKEK
ncbi:MAG: 30S ribosomal protein S24e [Candidatus Thermoplasmatota archaeon]|nr:30S ribosomal protein S24e [Candidatus Thermoplasmatota archaeon]